MKLLAPSMKYAKEIQKFREEFVLKGGDMDGCLSLRRMSKISDWIEQCEKFSKAETCPKGFVPTSQFIYLREADNKIVGVIQIRHYLNDYLRMYGGHIGYSVCHSERRKGYATKMLKEILPVCRSLGLHEIMISCLKENVASKKTILNNGAVYDSIVYEPEHDVYLEKYWLDLEKASKND